MQKFKELTGEKGIDEKNIMNFMESGNGIILFPKCIIHSIGKYMIWKQINLLKISFSINNLFYNLLLKKKEEALEILGNASNLVQFFFLSFSPSPDD